MEYIKWKEEYSVGIEIIDIQHQSLFKIINEFYNSIKENHPIEALIDLLNKLKDYTIYHFTTEENILQKKNLPSYSSHKTQHDLFIQKITDYQNRVKEGKLLLSIEVTDFLKNWLTNHILKVDKENLRNLK